MSSMAHFQCLTPVADDPTHKSPQATIINNATCSANCCLLDSVQLT